ncbi:DUF3950 domain-containing protein [Gilliamella sp. B14448G11]|uniref:YlcI/YnfO family protein n=1 Tax=unclassified Gilliamella TaxID=2685620 RepID=UPI0018DC7580|nr:DUF3950 domain-containing protein [Gilliamella sp. B14448G7]MBI0035515.1 DUF3950 domain-containing protein [Gilliamella sp. B14448G11]MBI0041211.1 DUF3950 domain-containing protein [Gilliamella sp. B14448G12]
MANETSKSKRKDIRFPHELIEKIDEQSKKENTNFSAWVIGACREKLNKPNKK